jgi:hypothetical protein
MNIFSDFYFTLFSVESFIPTVFMWLTALFFLTIRDKSLASLHFGIAIAGFGVIPACYFAVSSYYNPIGPAIANLKSSQGVIGRGTFMTIYNFMVVLGIFSIIMVYINNTASVKNIHYVSRFSVKNNSLSISYPDEENNIKFNKFIGEYYNTYIKFTDSINEDEINPNQKFLTFTEKLRDDILPYKIKIENLHAADFGTSLHKTLENVDTFFLPFKNAMLENLKHTDLDDAELKSDVLQYLSDMKNEVISEVGFSYMSYREFIHPAAAKFIMIFTDNLMLNNSSYVVFLNGDAMGKSLQGAGGALVLGAAFQSVLERSKLAQDVKKQSPERWLKNSFREMHRIFESFSGSMIISAVIGLIKESTGLLYFINAEHPWTVLYRDGKAQFIEKDSIFRKLGSAILSGRLFIQIFQLKHMDVIFAGSDGRDDLFLGTDEKGLRIINEDETLFLRAIEDGRGELPNIVKEITNNGKLIDDLSLIKIEYSNPDQFPEPDSELESYLKEAIDARKKKNIKSAIKTLLSARKEKKEHPLVLKEILKNYLIEKDYKNAVKYGTKYCEISPNDTQSIFALSYALRRTGDYTNAIEYGERVRSRIPKHEQNLVNLSQSYFYNKNFERS